MKKKINYGYFNWQDCCPLCGEPNPKSNKCSQCGFIWEKGRVYFSTPDKELGWQSQGETERGK
jgi:hypothetical protein